ncbi:MAG: MFS transporter [Desertifilum sp. SIO1I2]|nr:MFS transporter [Desertifilum sp. SIO1I2]
MRGFLIIWSGQFVSAIGSAMTQFALTIWVWELTGAATAIALFSFFFQLPQIFVTLFAGLLADRFNRKHLMIFSDTCIVLCTLMVGLLYATDALRVWHLYCLAAVYGCFGPIQNLAYSTAIPLIVSSEHYTRVSSLSSLVTYASAIFAPALAGSLYPSIGLLGIIWIDIATFAIAVATLIWRRIPQPPPADAETSQPESMVQKVVWGFRYIFSRPNLWVLTLTFSLFWFFQQLGETLYQPMILARSGGDAQVLGAVVTAAGVGGAIGAIALGIWGGFRSRVRGMLVGFIGIGLSKIALGVSRIPPLWMGAQFFASLHLPLAFSSTNAIWYSAIPSHAQGRVFAADQAIGTIVGTFASLIAGPIADFIFEPAMQPGGALTPIFGRLFGSETGSGIAFVYTLSAVCILALGLVGSLLPSLHRVEKQSQKPDTVTES